MEGTAEVAELQSIILATSAQTVWEGGASLAVAPVLAHLWVETRAAASKDDNGAGGRRGRTRD